MNSVWWTVWPGYLLDSGCFIGIFFLLQYTSIQGFLAQGRMLPAPFAPVDVFTQFSPNNHYGVSESLVLAVHVNPDASLPEVSL